MGDLLGQLHDLMTNLSGKVTHLSATYPGDPPVLIRWCVVPPDHVKLEEHVFSFNDALTDFCAEVYKQEGKNVLNFDCGLAAFHFAYHMQRFGLLPRYGFILNPELHTDQFVGKA